MTAPDRATALHQALVSASVEAWTIATVLRSLVAEIEAMAQPELPVDPHALLRRVEALQWTIAGLDHHGDALSNSANRHAPRAKGK